MRNLKKIVAVLLTVALLASMMVSALAAVSNTDKALKLQQIGLMAGTEADLKLEEGVTRIQGLAFAIRAAGKEADAFAMTDEEVAVELAKFTDSATIPGWGTKYAAYAIKNGITVGKGNGLLGALDPISGPSFLVFVLKAGMGYSEATTAESLIDLVVEAEIFSAAQAAAIYLKASLIRDDAALVLYGAAQNGVNADGTTFIQSLVDAGFVDQETAYDAGFGEAPAPEVLEVESVEAVNLVQTEVVFSGELDQDTAEDVANYTLTDADDNDVAIHDAELQDDGVTVVLFHNDIDQQDKAVLEINGVKDAAEANTVKDYVSDEVEYIDMTIPKAISAKVVGNDTIQVTFSEPMDPAKAFNEDNYEVDEGDLYINTVTPLDGSNNTVAEIVVFSDLEEGTVTVTVNNDEVDYAGFGIMPKTFELPVVPDEDGPEAIGYKDASKTGVTLIFNEDIELANDDLDKIYHTNSGNPIVTTAAISGNELKLDFTGNALPEGTAYVYILKDTINDKWDNKNAQIMIKIEVEVDETAPTLDKVDVKTEAKIILEFNEALKEDIAEEMDNYTLLKDGEDVSDKIDDITYSDKKVTIEFTGNLSGEYAIVVENIEDANGNEMAKVTKEFNVTDKTKPDPTKFTAKLYNEDAKGQMVKVSFGDVMATDGKYSVLDLEKYTINNEALADLEAKPTIKLVDGGKAVEIKVPSSVDNDKGIDLDFGTDEITIARVADAAGNYMDLFTYTFDIADADYVTISKAEATERNKIVITFSDMLEDFDAGDVIITTDNTNATNASLNMEALSKRQIGEKDGKTTLTLTLVDKLNTTFAGAGLYAYVVDNESENKYGETLAIDNNLVVADKIAPVLYDDGVSNNGQDYLNVTSGDAFALKFSEGISADSDISAAFDFVVKSGSKQLVANVDYVVSVSGDSVSFTILKSDYFGKELTVKLSDSVNFIKDGKGNKISGVDIRADLEQE